MVALMSAFDPCQIAAANDTLLAEGRALGESLTMTTSLDAHVTFQR